MLILSQYQFQLNDSITITNIVKICEQYYHDIDDNIVLLMYGTEKFSSISIVTVNIIMTLTSILSNPSMELT